MSLNSGALRFNLLEQAWRFLENLPNSAMDSVAPLASGRKVPFFSLRDAPVVELRALRLDALLEASHSARFHFSNPVRRVLFLYR